MAIPQVAPRLVAAGICLAAILTGPDRFARALGLPADQPARIVVEPNVLVSRDGDVPHVETMVAANPADGKNLLGTAIVAARPDGGTTCKTYASRDGGITWLDAAFPERLEYRSADPQVAFGPDGAAYFLMLSSGPDHPTHFRSGDGGFSWTKGGALPGRDHPQLVVDQGRSPFRGRLYVTAMRTIRQLVVTRSEDGGRTFSEPVAIPNPQDHWQLNDNPLVLSDGTLFVPYIAWNDAARQDPLVNMLRFVTSGDGGVTLSPPAPVLEYASAKRDEGDTPRGRLIVRGLRAAFAVDTGRRVDRLYVAWSDARSGTQRIMLASSADRGKTWSAPRPVCAAAAEPGTQYQVTLAVNPEGTVGVGWFEIARRGLDDQYDHLFTASLDGGETFLRPRRVSSQSSLAGGAGNRTPFPAPTRPLEGTLDQRFTSAFDRWGAGGDYSGLCVDADGAFRPFWPDSRSGTFQVYTTRVRVLRTAAAAADLAPPAGLASAPVTRHVQLVFDPPRLDLEKGETSIGLRLRNVSPLRLYAPLRARVVKVQEWTLLGKGKEENGAGETLEFTPTLGDLPYLAPGAITEPLRLRFRRAPDDTGSPTLSLSVTAQVVPERPP